MQGCRRAHAVTSSFWLLYSWELRPWLHVADHQQASPAAAGAGDEAGHPRPGRCARRAQGPAVQAGLSSFASSQPSTVVLHAWQSSANAGNICRLCHSLQLKLQPSPALMGMSRTLCRCPAMLWR